MGDAVIFVLVEEIMGNLKSLVLREFRFALGLKTELEKLQSTLTTIRAVLQDAEEKQTKSKALRNWLTKIRDVAYDVDDLLDEFAVQVLQPRSIKYQVCTFFSLRNPLVFPLKMGRKIKDIGERLDAIAEERSKFHLIEGIMDTKLDFQTSSLVIESEIYGRNEEKEMIVELLLSNVSNQDDVSIYAIFGMGGLGKTTLAQLVYNDKRVESHFELRIWVCVSDDFEIRRLTRAILESAGGSASDISQLDPMQRRLEEKLRGRRFLLVLDDVWNEDNEKWDGLKHVLRCGGKGSRVIVTTRIEKVALTMATLPTHHLRCLSEVDCWSLFRQRAFGWEGREEHPDLVAIGKAIVKKCGGVALAVKALGSLMRFKTEESEWLLVKESQLWNLSDDECAILPALRLSYNHLPSHLRQCFAYCSIFPKDYVFEKDTLIQLWMANGFIPPKGRMELHDIGHEIFNDLVWRSFFQDIQKDSHGNITSCKIHDLMHDLAQSIMKDECFIVEHSKPQKIPEKIRHLSFNLKSSWAIPLNQDRCKVQSLRSLILISIDFRTVIDVFTYISKQNFLRVLYLNIDGIEKLPMSIGNLKHLRYLDLSYSSIRKLPASMSCLPNLQTLKLRSCSELCKLPNDMRHMSNLTYLDIAECDSLTYMPTQMGQLTRLKILSKFIVGKDRGRHIGELSSLNLRGELSIEDLENVRDLIDAKVANLIGKRNLQSLMLFWRYDVNAHVQANLEDILEGLRPHSNLKYLRVSGYQGSVFPHWMRDLLLPNLVEIALEGCARCEHLPPLSKLRFLKVLTVCEMNAVKYFDCNDYGDSAFSALEQLTIYRMPSLEEWTSVGGKGSFLCLRNLTINECPKLTTLPLLPLLENLTIIGPNLKSLSNELDNLVTLKILYLSNCSELEYLPWGLQNLTSLETLDIMNCDGLIKLFPKEGLQGLSSLRKLWIQNCKKLMSLSEGFQYLTALQNLLINGCPKLTCLPDSMQHLISLRTLHISRCKGLIPLPQWLENLMLISFVCPELQCQEAATTFRTKKTTV